MERERGASLFLKRRIKGGSFVRIGGPDTVGFAFSRLLPNGKPFGGGMRDTSLDRSELYTVSFRVGDRDEKGNERVEIKWN